MQGPNLYDLESSFFDNITPIRLGPLLGCEKRHHEDVSLARYYPSSPVWNHHLVDQDFRIPGLHCRSSVLQNLNAVFVGQVAEDLAKIVAAGTYREEVST